MSADSWLAEYQERLISEQKGKPHEAILETMQAKSEHVFDPATAAPVLHNWIDRGLKYSCENAGHEYHQAWKRQVKPME
jgi:hypothetical protein